MKLITAIIPEDKLDEVREALITAEIERITVSLSMICEIFGMSSQIWTPGKFVLIGRKGPPVSRPGFISNVSN